MLKEFKNVAQRGKDPGYRRWFSDEQMELIVWYSDAGRVTGFQLCYDRDAHARAFTWDGAGVSHSAVDWGEDSPLSNDAPVLTADGQPPLERVLAEFKGRARDLEPSLTELVSNKVASFQPKPKT